jgi:hypothetical protein
MTVVLHLFHNAEHAIRLFWKFIYKIYGYSKTIKKWTYFADVVNMGDARNVSNKRNYRQEKNVNKH